MGENEDSFFMQRSLELSVKGHPSPNPYVGAVIVKEGKIVGEGFHSFAGKAHAEIEAISDVKRKHGGSADEVLKGSTLYVTLEPCNHTGKTPPCTKAILEAGISKVVFAMKDENKAVKGDGEKFLRENGVEVSSGVLGIQAKAVNAAYLKVLKEGIPLLTLKMACTMDGKTATATGDSKWISSEKSREIVMKMRDKADAVLVGANTVVRDDPRLTARIKEEEKAGGQASSHANPLRVIVDSNLKIKADSKVFSDGNALVAYCKGAERKEKEFAGKGIEILKCPKDGNEHVDLKFLLRELAKKGKNQVLCEGGATLAKSLLDAGLIDAMIVFYSPKIIGGEGRGLFEGAGAALIKDAKKCELINAMETGGDLMVVLKMK